MIDTLEFDTEQVGFDAAELERDIIAERLQKDVVSLLFSLRYPAFSLTSYLQLEVSGKLHLRIADKVGYRPTNQPFYKLISLCTSSHTHLRLLRRRAIGCIDSL